jgi:hypothetical protein
MMMMMYTLLLLLYLVCPFATGGNIIEYIATFPNVTVNVGDEYEVCVLPVNDLRLICTSGQNSPAARPEFVDISLNQTTTTALSEEVASSVEEEGEAEEERQILLQPPIMLFQ